MASIMGSEPIGDTIPKIRIEPEGRAIPATILNCGALEHRGDRMWIPEGAVVVEDFPPETTFWWAYWYDEVQYILGGKADITYTLPASRFSVEKTMTVETGDCYIIPSGARLTFKVAPGGPLKKFCVMMPGPRLYLREAIAPESRFYED